MATLQTFRAKASEGEWASIHSGHFDWWMFPIEDGSQRQFNVFEDDVRELIEDEEWLGRYRESLILVSQAWGWDLPREAPVQPPVAGQGWTNWDVRLSKMIRSTWIFGEALSAERRSLQKFALWIKPQGGLRYGHINLDEVYFME